MNNIRNSFCCIFCLMTLAGCAGMRTEEPEPVMYSEPRYQSKPIMLKVAKVDVVPEFTPSFTRPNVEHLFPVSIEKTAELWAKDRLGAGEYNSERTAEFIIKDASVVETEEKAEQLFEKDKLKYRAVLAVTLRVSDPERQTTAETSVEAWRELIIPVDTSVAEKEMHWNDMVQKLFDAFDERMETRIHQSLNMYVQNNNWVREYY